MLRTAFASVLLSVIIYVLGRTGLSGLPMELGRIFLMVFLVLSTVVVGGQLLSGRHQSDVL